MACTFEYKGKTYDQDGLAAALRDMSPTEAAPHIPGIKAVPDAPFKDSWHRLALNDMIREAAEKGADEISWTAGRSQPTNPKNLNTGGVMNDERRAAYEKSEKGLVKFYDDTLVNVANKIGKAHGVSVEHGMVPRGDTFSAEEKGRALMARDGITDEQWRNMSPADRQQKIASWQDAGHDIFRMKVPQSLKDQALKKGFSLFEDAGLGAAAAVAAHAGEGNVGAARGQNSWLNYGPHGKTNRKASAADTHYADQKVGLMPDWTMGDAYPGKPDWHGALQGMVHPGAKFGERYPETIPPIDVINKKSGKPFPAAVFGAMRPRSQQDQR